MSAGAYTPLQRALHWIVAALVIALIPAGLLIEGYDPEVAARVNGALGAGAFDLIYDLHKSAGLTVLGLMILRAAARAARPPAPHDPPLRAWERAASRIVHLLLYALLIAAPIVGWIGVSLYPAPAPVWFLFDARLPLTPDRALSETLLGQVHGPMGVMIGLLAAAHVLAALKHAFIDRDGVMRRMLGGG